MRVTGNQDVFWLDITVGNLQVSQVCESRRELWQDESNRFLLSSSTFSSSELNCHVVQQVTDRSVLQNDRKVSWIFVVSIKGNDVLVLDATVNAYFSLEEFKTPASLIRIQKDFFFVELFQGNLLCSMNDTFINVPKVAPSKLAQYLKIPMRPMGAVACSKTAAAAAAAASAAPTPTLRLHVASNLESSDSGEADRHGLEILWKKQDNDDETLQQQLLVDGSRHNSNKIKMLRASRDPARIRITIEMYVCVTRRGGGFGVVVVVAVQRRGGSRCVVFCDCLYSWCCLVHLTSSDEACSERRLQANGGTWPAEGKKIDLLFQSVTHILLFSSHYMHVSEGHTMWGEVFGVVAWLWVFHRARHDLPVLMGFRHPWEHAEDPFQPHVHAPHPEEQTARKDTWDKFSTKAISLKEDDDDDDDEDDE
jgi:hypothetical protein